MADIARAWLAVDHLWSRLRTMAARPAITTADIDAFSDELRHIEAGLQTTRKYLQEVRGARIRP